MTIISYIEQLEAEHGFELYFRNIKDKYNKWSENVKTREDKKILEKIFLELRFYSKIEMKQLLEDKINELKLEYNGLEQAVICPMVPPEGRQSGANDLTGLIKEIVQEKFIQEKEYFLPSKDTLIQDLKYIGNSSHIIIVDDIIGTGGTFSKYLEVNEKSFENKTLILLCISITKKGLEKLEELKVKYTSINFDIRYDAQPSKLSELKVLSDEEYERLKVIEQNLWKRNKTYTLGYKQSELLILFSHNIPNNSLSSFWFNRDDIPWEALFPRISPPNRKQQNYHNKKRNGNAKRI